MLTSEFTGHLSPPDAELPAEAQCRQRDVDERDGRGLDADPDPITGQRLSPLWVDASDIAGYHVSVRVEPQNGHLVAAELVVRQRPGGPSVTLDGIRGIAVGRLVREAARYFEAVGDAGSGERQTPDDLAPENVKRLVAAGPTSETLDVLAHCYRRAMLLGDPPAKAVQDTFGLSRSKTGRWVALARAGGYLGPSEGPGKASG